MRKLNYVKVEEVLIAFIIYYFMESGFKKAVIGLSGGLDSAVVCALAVRALGAENVIAIYMPFKDVSTESSRRDAEDVAQRLGVRLLIKPITETVESFRVFMGGSVLSSSKHDEQYILRLGNACARVRMMMLFDYASANSTLVLGTENRSESLLGYYTLFGDEASCIECISPLFKTEVVELAKHLGLPEYIVNKEPSAELWKGQTDEGELGFTYTDADPILYLISRCGCPAPPNLLSCFDTNLVDKVTAQVKRMLFKGSVPVTPDDNILEDCIVAK